MNTINEGNRNELSAVFLNRACLFFISDLNAVINSSTEFIFPPVDIIVKKFNEYSIRLYARLYLLSYQAAQ